MISGSEMPLLIAMTARKGMDEEVYRTVPEEELYASTGIQKQIFNSIYQLMAWKKKKAGTAGKKQRLF